MAGVTLSQLYRQTNETLSTLDKWRDVFPPVVYEDYEDDCMAVGDVTSNEPGSGARYNDGKVRYDLIPTHLLESTANVLEYGANKYAPWNWAKGMQYSVVLGCIKRHLAAIERGEDLDPETGERHAGHMMCNLLFLEHYMNAFPEMDDRPKWFAKQKDTNVEQRTAGTRASPAASNPVVECRLLDLRPHLQSPSTFLFAADGTEWWRGPDGAVARYDYSGTRLD